MKLLFKQRTLSWFDSYDIYDEDGNVIFVVKGELSWGHRLNVYDVNENHIATLQEEVLTLLPRFKMYVQDEYIGQILKEFSFFKPKFNLECNGWHIEGDFFEWDYSICDENGCVVADIS